MKLYSYWRSTAAYRVRIALELKSIDYEYVPVHLVKDGGQHRAKNYLEKNPMGLVPLLETDSGLLSESLAIIQYLDTIHPTPSLYSDNPVVRARMESVAQIVACDIHPLNNLRVLQYLGKQLSIDETQRTQWYHHWLEQGFNAIEALIMQDETDFCFSNTPSIADICLVAQVYNAERFKYDLDAYPNIVEVTGRCLDLDAFKKALPENQPDAE